MPKFLSLEGVIAIHYDQIATFGGAQGLRDQGLLESALGQARQTHANKKDIYEAAAQYCVSLAKNHPFVDGNKRTAAACMLTFMLLNRIEPTLTADQLFEWTLRVAISALDRAALATLLREHSRHAKR